MKFTKTTFLIFFLIAVSSAYSQTFNGTTGTISDDGQYNYFTANVSGLSPSVLDTNHGLVSVCVNISHTWDSDLNVCLIAPDNTVINLFSGIGGDGDNFTNTCLSQSAVSSVVTASAPFTGTFRPQETLGNMNNGQNGNGTWMLRIDDTYPQDQGFLNNWSITFGNNASGPNLFTESNLPIVIINTNGVAIPDEPKIDGTIKIIYNGPGQMNHITDSVYNYQGNIGIELRGATSQWYPQKPYKFETRDNAGMEVNVSILSMPAENEWCLLTNWNDKVFLRNTLAFRLFEKMGHYATRTRYCEVVLNGSYQGIYLLSESVKRDNNRVDIAKLDSTENTGLNVTGGYILKNDLWDGNGWILSYTPPGHPEYNEHLLYEYPKPENITPQQEAYIQLFIGEMEDVLYGPGFADPVNGFRKYMSQNSFIDYFIVNELSRNNDGFKKSIYYHKEINTATEIGKLKAGPVWDFDWAWKNMWDCFIFQNTDGSGWAHLINDCGPDNPSNGWYLRMLQDTAFQNSIRCRWDDFRNSFMSNDSMFQYIDSIAAYLDAAQQRHYDKWGTMGVNTGTAEIEQDPPTFAAHITQFKNWIATRSAWLDANMPGNTSGCTTGANENNFAANTVLVFPQPADDLVAISFAGMTGVQYTAEMLTSAGTVAGSFVFSGTDVVIPLSSFSDGMYYCRISNGSQIICMQKVAVMHQF